MYNAYVTRIKNVRPHPNADRLQLGDCFGNTVCVDLSYAEGQTGVYFPTDGQLSVEFAEANNLLRKKDDTGNNCGGYMDPSKRNVTAIRLRGEKSDGIFLPLTCLESFGDISALREGDVIDTFNGHEICCKYIPHRNSSSHSREGNRLRKKQDANQAQIDAAKQIMSMLIIDKKKMKLKEAGIPKIVLDQTPKYLQRSKVPVVKAKIGPKVMTLMADPKVYEQIPVKAEVKAEVSGIYITGIKSVRGGKIVVEEKKKKKGFFRKNK